MRGVIFFRTALYGLIGVKNLTDVEFYILTAPYLLILFYLSLWLNYSILLTITIIIPEDYGTISYSNNTDVFDDYSVYGEDGYI